MMRARSPAGEALLPLRCPACGIGRPAEERFCPDCHLPLILAEHDPAQPPDVDARHARARKVKPQLAEGPLVQVAGARNQAEGELLQGLLLEAGVPSLLRRSAGFDVPDFLAAGPRDVLVPQSGAVTAREVLLAADLVDSGPPRAGVSPARLLAGLLVVFAAGALIIWLGTLLIH